MTTAEIRWFFGEVVSFDSLMQSLSFSEPSKRVDYYLLNTGVQLGVKWREGRLEAKQQQGVSQSYSNGQLEGEIACWKKWSFALDERETYSDNLAEQPQHWLAVHKQRQQVQFTHDARQQIVQADSGRQVHDGCQLEVTYLTLRKRAYTTLGLEAFGSERSPRQNLMATIGYLLESGNLEGLDLSLRSSNNYAHWIHTNFNNTTS